MVKKERCTGVTFDLEGRSCAVPGTSPRNSPNERIADYSVYSKFQDVSMSQNHTMVSKVTRDPSHHACILSHGHPLDDSRGYVYAWKPPSSYYSVSSS